MMYNNQSDNKTQSNGIGFVGALQLLFITLKFLGYIEWSWWWVLTPTWVCTTLFIIFVVLIIANLISKQ